MVRWRNSNLFDTTLYYEILFCGVTVLLFGLYYIGQKKLHAASFAAILSLVIVLYAIIRATTRRLKPSFSLSYGALLVIAFFSSSIAAIATYALVSHQSSPGTMLLRVMMILWNIFSSYLLYAALTVVSFSIGSALMRRWATFDELAQFLRSLLAIALGYIAIMYWFYAWSMLHQIRLGFILFACGAIIMLYLNRMILARFIRTRLSFDLRLPIQSLISARSWLICIAITLGAAFLILHYSWLPQGGDDWRTYLNIPTTFIKHNGYVLFKYDLINQSPLIGTYLLIPLLITSAGAAALFSPYLFIMSLIAGYCLATSILSGRAVWYAVMGTALLSIQLFLLASFRPDYLVAYLFTLCLIIASYVLQRKNAPYAIAIGMLLGAMVAIKYNALIAVFSFVVFFLVQKITIAPKIRTLSIITLTALILFAPFAIHNIALSGNPLHPFKTAEQYGYNTTDASVYSKVKHYMLEDSLRSFYFNSESSFIHKMLTTGFIVGIWPINNFGPVLLLGVLSFIPFIRRNSHSTNALLLVLSITFALWQFADVDQIHYLNFLFLLILIVLANNLSKLRSSLPLQMTMIALAAIFVSDSGLTKAHAPIYLNAFHLADDQTLGSYIQSEGRLYKRARLIQRLAARHPDYVILQFSTYNIMHTDDNYLHVYNNYAQTVFADAAFRSQSNAELIKLLRDRGITHIYIAKDETFDDRLPLSDDYPFSTYIDARRESLFEAIPVEMEDASGIIYRLAILDR